MMFKKLAVIGIVTILYLIVPIILPYNTNAKPSKFATTPILPISTTSSLSSTNLQVIGVLSSPGISFSGDWEQGLIGNGNWLGVQSVASDRFQRVTSPVRQGQYAARVEVRPGDDPLGLSTERAEVFRMTDINGNEIEENESSGIQYYAFSVRLDPNWQSPEPGSSGLWSIIFQLHGPDNLKASPSFSIHALDHFEMWLHSGDLDSPTNSLRWQKYPFSNSNLNRGKWVDIVVKIKFAKDFTGSVDVWRRDEGQGCFIQVLSVKDVPTLQYKSSLGGVGNHCWKHGLYRPSQTTITNILWLDGLTRGDTFDHVVQAAFPSEVCKEIYLPLVGF